MKQILIIDKDVEYTQKLKDFLEFSRDIKVFSALGEDDYFDILSRESIDLIIVDVSPSEIKKPWNVFHFLRKDREFKDIPVAASSVVKDAELIVKVIKEGGKGFIDKNEEMEKIKEKINQIIASQEVQE